jgi:hypothetical protein
MNMEYVVVVSGKLPHQQRAREVVRFRWSKSEKTTNKNSFDNFLSR